jgi:hypothetical protein
MNEPSTGRRADVNETVVPAYEAPRVESVVTSDEVEREALYGGGISMS